MRRKTKRICAEPDCGETFEYDPHTTSRADGQYCELHRDAHRKDRKQADPETQRKRQRIYSSRHWKLCRKKVMDRDGHLCVICGATELESRLVVDHIGGIDYEDPYNPDKCRTLCLVCSGRIDGARGALH